MYRLVSKIFYTIYYIIFPSFCICCNLETDYDNVLCNNCNKCVPQIATKTIKITAEKSVTVFSASAYMYPTKKLVLAKQYKSITSAHKLGKMMWQLSNIKTTNFDFITFVPLHITRQTIRGYNQAHESAKILSSLSHKKIISPIYRSKMTEFQFLTKTIKNRYENIYNAFEFNQEYKNTIKDKTILIVDDLMTTGITLSAVSKLLYKNGALNVIAVVGCRAL